jgi:membrane fusion protein (multidrug efflux system)
VKWSDAAPSRKLRSAAAQFVFLEKPVSEANQKGPEEQTTASRPAWIAMLRRYRWSLLVGGPVVIAAIVLVAVVLSGGHVTTDNAYVRALRVAVSSSVSGRIISIAVHENQAVKKGDLLFTLDPGDFSASVAEAEAQYSAARLQVDALRAAYRQRLTELASAESAATYAQRERARQHELVAIGSSSQQDYARAVNEANRAAAELGAARQAVAAALADLGGRANVKTDAHPRVKQARAALDEAQRNLNHATIVAAADGVVTKVDQIGPGPYVTAAQPLFWLISGAPWIEANFKEDQLAHLRIGQSAAVELDAFPGKKLKARVSSFSPGVGAAFAVLPPENATGNWVKVTQRLPVQLTITQAPRDVFLAAGLSAKVDVDTHSRSDSVVAAAP